jgi:hypothetical protein
MKKLLFSLFCLLSALTASAQQRPYPSVADAESLGSGVTCVVLEDNRFSFYNAEIKSAVNKYWKLTPVRFITSSEFDSMRTDRSFSFIVLTATSFSNDKSGTEYDFLNLLLGADVESLSEMPEFCAIPLCYTGAPEEEYSYKLGLILRFMQYHAGQIIKNPRTLALRDLKYYNSNVSAIAGKTLLVREMDLAPEINTVEKIADVYHHPVIIADEDEMIKAVDEGRKDTVILHKVGPESESREGMCIKMLIGTDDAVMYYYDSHLINSRNANGLLVSDLKRLNRF